MGFSKSLGKALNELPEQQRERLVRKIQEFEEFRLIFTDEYGTGLKMSKARSEEMSRRQRQMPIEDKIRLNEGIERAKEETFGELRDFYRTLAQYFGLERAQEILYASINEYVKRWPSSLSQRESKTWKWYAKCIIAGKNSPD